MQLIELLAQKHSKDVFVAECKNGPTWFGSHLRLDAWAMVRSWAHPRTVAYEIKMSRADWKRDDKWTDYLQYCNELYFVIPDKSVILPTELPPEAGLFVASTHMSKLYMLKKAAYRQVTIPEKFYRYVLMSRVVVSDSELADDGRAEYFRAWLKRKREWNDLGTAVSSKVQKHLSEANAAVHKMQMQIETYEAVKKRIIELGGDPDRPISHWNMKREVDKLLDSGLPNELGSRNLLNIRDALDGLATQIKKLEEGQ